MKRKWRLYLDTSVFGGCFDAAQGWVEDSQRVLNGICDGEAHLLYSDSVEEELEDAPDRVQALLESIPPQHRTKIEMNAEIDALSQAYLQAGIVGPKWLDDTIHVATATVARADAIVSWNFKHIASLDKMKAYNQVNLALGHGMIVIVTPKAVNFDE
jgi:predicted nucleic acid-binding protein